ncbi:MAG TPA: MFS transporter [Candidatus Limnocylindrales bacterium]|nr:MFS transporter [Candidatus Limnocylindrales bacterium]
MISPHQTTAPGAALSIAEERAILSVACLAAFLFFNSFGSISVALPTIQKQFGNSLSEIQWITLMGVVTISSLSFCFGRAGAILGQRRLYKIGVALYATGAGLGALAVSFSQLLMARAVMAVGLAMALPMSTALLASSFANERRGQVLGTFASAIAVGRMTGPSVGGFLLQLGGWTWIFWMNFVVGSAVTVAVIKIFRGAGEQRHEQFDIWGSVALLIGYPSLLIGLSFGAALGWNSPWVISWFAVAAAGLASFVAIERHTQRPLVDVTIFRNKALSAAMIAVILSHMIHNPIALAAPLYLQNVLGASALGAGFLLAILPLSTALLSPLSGRLADRFDATSVSAVGIGLIVVGIAGYACLGVDSHFAWVGAVLGLLGAGIGVFTPANQKVAFGSVTQNDYGVLAAMLSSFGTAAGTIGTTIAVALMEIDGGPKLWSSRQALAGAQQFAFTWLVPLGLIALIVGVCQSHGSNRAGPFKS